ncbi:MAG: YraN family protein [Lachnospiraceae bacterium]|nr:YraN family protein [Lachnospiraceae bacterium]
MSYGINAERQVGNINKRKVGSEKEAVAADYLSGIGYQILERNFYSRTGEIDLVAREGGYLVFVEVKYRKNNASGYPEEAVTPAKQRAIVRTARYYMLRNKYPEMTPCRFDVVAITGMEIRLIQNAFGA